MKIKKILTEQNFWRFNRVYQITFSRNTNADDRRQASKAKQNQLKNLEKTRQEKNLEVDSERAMFHKNKCVPKSYKCFCICGEVTERNCKLMKR